MLNKRFDVCIIADRESDFLDRYVYENLRDLKVIQCFNFSLSRHFKTNFKMDIDEGSKFSLAMRSRLGYYEDIIKNSEFVFFDISIFNAYYVMLHMGMALALDKPIYIINNTNRCRSIFSGRFGVGILNKINTTINNEVERKWLISEDLYNQLIDSKKSLAWNFHYNTKITQFVDDHGIRYRKQSTDASKKIQHIKCVKSDKSEFMRFEIESVINKDLYDIKLDEFKKSDKYYSVINKDRATFYMYDTYIAIDRIKIGSNYFYILEIEYNDTNQINNDILYIINNLGIKNYNYYEFTNSKELSNKSIMKLNARKRNDIEQFSSYVNGLCENCFVKIKK